MRSIPDPYYMLFHLPPPADIKRETIPERLSILMAFDTRNTTPRKKPRFEVRMPITVSGIDSDGHYFRTSAETVNYSTEGMGFFLDRDLYPHTVLVISIPREKLVLQLQTEVRHITSLDISKKLIGVRFRKAEVV